MPTSERCTFKAVRGGRTVQCELACGHAGDHEVQDGPASVVSLPRTPYKSPKSSRAYLIGACDYATGLGLDRLARDMGLVRVKGESDHDLSMRVRSVVLGGGA